jgi:hypothetical protein
MHESLNFLMPGQSREKVEAQSLEPVVVKLVRGPGRRRTSGGCDAAGHQAEYLVPQLNLNCWVQV